MVNMTVDTLEFQKGMDKVSKEFEDLMYERMKAVSAYLKKEVMKEVPSNTGILRASIFGKTHRKKGEIKTVVGSNSQYAAYVHQGTGIYVPGGRKTKWRYFVAAGKYKGWHITNGQKPNPFLLRARDKSIEDIKKLLGVD